MTDNKASRPGKGKLIGVRNCYRIWPGRGRESLDQDPVGPRPRRLPSVVKALAVLAAVAIPLSVVQPTPATRRVISAAEQFGQAATTAFAQSAAGLDTSLTSSERATGLPVNPTAGLISQSPAGPVQMALPSGLGSGQVTSAGQMVYPDAGAGFDLLAENTRQGHRTVARINNETGVRSVTTLVRTPADTVMLIHSNGYLSLNRATEHAETIGVMSPAEARDATGAVVYSAYVAKQVAPQLYQVSEVIAPAESTTWPVYVDPPDLAQWSWSDTGNALGGAAEAVGNGFKKAGEFIGQAMQAQADSNAMVAQAQYQAVKEHPAESAMLIGSGALMATGVGSAAGAGVLARVALTVNTVATGTEAVAAIDPNNKGLQNFSTGMQIVAAITPQGLTKKTVTSVAENALEQGVKRGADNIASEAATVTRVTPETATNPTQLAKDIAETAKAPAVPKAPNAPPATSLPACSHMDCGHVNENPAVVYNAGTMREHFDHKLDAIENGQPGTLTRGNPDDTAGRRRDALGSTPTQTGKARDEYPFASTAEGGAGSSVRYVPRGESNREGPLLSGFYKKNQVREGDRFDLAFRGDDGKVRCATCAIDQRAADRQIAARPSLPARPASPADQRQLQAARAEQATQAQRSKALQGARTVNNVSQQQSQHNSAPQTVHARPESEAQQRDNQAVRSTSVTKQTRDHAREGARPSQNNPNTHNGNSSSHDSGSHSKNNGSKKNNKGNGKGNRAKRSRTGRH
ncbi:HNH endonuclease [Mycobacteroides abscessus subsp. massiliense]|uniref:NucA/NucB deoxyribonuclease domain-containing protein n=1 Tax=Mycobacteroides abscessus TaxID=36809 RepID=UPI0009A6153D|nr:NucA/NucB deoxyribonuclease domain-containing protein [Mycobacteroides abscessus]SKT95012.1 HNH endonuclease [Mycobacteroides abscessus subsp. massiliense]